MLIYHLFLSCGIYLLCDKFPIGLPIYCLLINPFPTEQLEQLNHVILLLKLFQCFLITQRMKSQSFAVIHKNLQTHLVILSVKEPSWMSVSSLTATFSFLTRLSFSLLSKLLTSVLPRNFYVLVFLWIPTKFSLTHIFPGLSWPLNLKYLVL